ncbi:MAG TPA: putative Ig domain-containing protein [Patescibacteria group bacterium]|nr:putative Ig domain-containing protein [Patescibacteria group bacterium]
MPEFLAGCGGALDDWEAVRGLDDPRDGSIRSLGVATDSCLRIAGSSLRDGVVSARIVPEEGPAGFAVRYRGPGDYLEITVDLGAGVAVARQHSDGQRQSLGTTRFTPASPGPHAVMAVFAGTHVAVFVDGASVYYAGGTAENRGDVGLLAIHDTLAEFDDLDWSDLETPDSPLLDPVSPAPMRVGGPIDLTLKCQTLRADQSSALSCSFEVERGSLPGGLELRRNGHIIGTPGGPGDYAAVVRVSLPDGRSAIRPLQLRVRAIRWPRFPFDARTRDERQLAVTYTPDDIGPAVTLESLGWPDKLLFRLHKDHPALKVGLMACPANRYFAGQRLVAGSPAAAVWRRLATDPAFGWVELGGHGYTHSPDGDANLDHHEFSVTETGCNVDHAKLSEEAYCRRHLGLAREAFRSIGIPDDKTIVMRFPGMADSPQALKAAAGAGFEAIFGSRHGDEAGREWWVPYPGGEILEIENTNLSRCFSRSKSLEADLARGSLEPGHLRSDPRFLAEVQRGRDEVDQIVAQGGIMNLFDHWWETFAEFGGVSPRYLVLDAVLDDVELRYGSRVWYPRSRDLALWLQARRTASVRWQVEADGLHVLVEPPAGWAKRRLTGIEEASIVVGLPAGYTGVSAVRTKHDGRAWQDLDRLKWWVVPDGLALSFPLKDGVEMHIVPATLPGGPAR